MTECIQERLAFSSAPNRREIVAEFSGGTISSDGGGLLLRETDAKMNLLPRFSQCFLDGRNPIFVEHSVKQMVQQRVHALALWYEDLNDHDQLRHDPLLGLMSGKAEPGIEPLAGKSTLNRMELGTGLPTRYKKITFWRDGVDELLVEVFLEAHATAPRQIVLDIDTTDMALHGNQESRFFHGYYGHYCYLPLYIFCGDHPLCARLRPSDIDARCGALKAVQRIVERIRRAWPRVRIVLRADSGFCREPLMRWCETAGVDYLFGLAKNRRLTAILGRELHEAKCDQQRTGQSARVFKDFTYRTRSSWSRARRVVGKAEHLAKGPNPRFVVPSLSPDEFDARTLYEQEY